MELEIISKKTNIDDESSNRKLRAAAYVRVSSNRDEQLDSFESQINY